MQSDSPNVDYAICLEQEQQSSTNTNVTNKDYRRGNDDDVDSREVIAKLSSRLPKPSSIVSPTTHFVSASTGEKISKQNVEPEKLKNSEFSDKNSGNLQSCSDYHNLRKTQLNNRWIKLDAAASVDIDSINSCADLRGACKDNTRQAQKSLGLGGRDASNFYGAVGKEGGISLLGSWALRTCKEQDISIIPGQGGTAANKTNVMNGFEGRSWEETVQKTSSPTQPSQSPSPGPRQWFFQAGTMFELRANHLFKAVCVMMILVVVISGIFHSRLRSVELQKAALVQELSQVRINLERLVQKLDTISIASPTQSEWKYNSEEYGPMTFEDAKGADDYNESEQSTKLMVKRSARAEPSRTTKGLHYSYNALNNGSTPFDSPMEWTTGVTPKTNSEKGNKDKRGRKYLRRYLRRELKELKRSNRIEISHLKQQLRQLQLANFSCCCCTQNQSKCTLHKLSSMPSSGCGSSFQETKTRAAYFQIDGSSVNIKKSRQLIGPWYLPETGKDIGFNDMWYDNLDLDANGTSIIFKEDGLFLIYAQVFYQLQHVHNSQPKPMGYRIHLRKNGNGKSNRAFRRPVTIAECVPSFPSTFYQTCFTQVAWFVEAQDELYLEHFTDSLPMIEALRTGQTFVGIVRLSN